jgi:hypothetical protein
VLELGLARARDGIVNPGRDPALSKELATGRSRHIEMIHRLGPFRLAGDGED